MGYHQDKAREMAWLAKNITTKSRSRDEKCNTANVLDNGRGKELGPKADAYVRATRGFSGGMNRTKIPPR
jgi:hypothetical protein